VGKGETLKLLEDLKQKYPHPANLTDLRKYRVVVAMRPWVFRDKFPRKPDKNAVLEMLLDKLQKKELDDRFVVLVEG
jgi:hypothetical protein